MDFQAILVLTDFSTAAAAAVHRAALLAADHGAMLTLMHVAAPGDAHPANAPVRLDQTARQLAQRSGLRVYARYATGEAAEAIAAEAARADLLVLPHQPVRGAAALLRTPLAVRLARRCRCPILVVKAPALRPYRKILVAVDFQARSQALVALACAVDRRSDIELFHAISLRDDARLRAAEASHDAVQAYRRRMRRSAQERLFALSDSFQARRNRMLMAIGHGDPARQAVVQQEYTGADLLLVGKRRAAPWVDLFFGSVAQRLLAWAHCDVILLPDEHRPATRAAARHRLQGERPDTRAALLQPPHGGL